MRSYVPLNDDKHILVRKMDRADGEMAHSCSRRPIHSHTYMDFYMSFPNGPSSSTSQSAQRPRLNHSGNGPRWDVSSCINHKWRRRRRSHWEAKGDTGPSFREWTRDNDELGMSPRQQAASSIIHLGNKLINEVNEEEQQQRKSCRWTKRDI